MTDPTYKDALGAPVRYADLAQSDGSRLPRSAPSDAAGAPLYAQGDKPSTKAGQDAAAAALANILSALGVTLKVATPLAAPIAGQVKIAVTGTAVQLPANGLVNGIAVKASPANAAQSVAPGTTFSGMVGGSGVLTTWDGTGNGYALAPGEGVTLAVSNANQVYVNGKLGDVFTYAGN